MSARITPQTPALQALRMRLHAQHQPVVLMRTDCHVCRAEGLAPRSQVLIIAGDRTVQALLYQIDSDLLKTGQIALSEAAWDALDIHEGDLVQVRHPPLLESLSAVRARIHGHRLQTTELQAIVRDVVDGRYTDVALSAFLTATAVLPLDMQETIHLTRAMVDVGDHLQWQAPIVVDKHCVGGLPGNRTTPLVVAIAAANGLVMPKTSSRAITSPAGTADTMETLAPVDLDLDTLRKVVEKEGGCVAWGGAMHLSPADDIFVRIERELDIDTQGQLIASVLSKKIAAGATHIVIDIPVGPTAKVRSQETAEHLAYHLSEVAASFGLVLRCLFTDGNQPVGRGIGPALEARDVLAVLRNEADAPQDLCDRVALVGKRPTATVFPSLIQRVIIARTRAPQCCVHKGDHGHKSPNGTRVQARPLQASSGRVQARRGGSVFCTRRVGIACGSRARHQCQPGLSVAQAVSGQPARGR